jgi:plastocyanin
MQYRTVVPYAVILATAVACGGGLYSSSNPVAPPPTSAGPTVAATPSIAFTPSTLNVAAGDTVTFAFGTVGHNVYFATVAGAPANITGVNANTSVTRLFGTAGTFAYSCHIHPEMHGTIVVAPAGTATSGNGGYGSRIGTD